jgi:small-conductance mechanosensitive channel
MTWNSVMGLVSLIALFLPIFFLLVLRLGAYKSFPALFIYYSLVFAYNLLSKHYFNLDSTVISTWNLCNNLLDAPLMMIFLTYFSTSQEFTKRMKLTVVLFMAYELIVIAVAGFNTQAITIILGPGIILIFAFCLHFFIRQTKITIMHRKATGKAIIAASLLFAYGCYGIIYLMYYVYKTPYVADTFLVYYLVVTFSSMLISAGIFIEKKRVRKLNELIQTRKELSMVYKESPSTPSFNKIALDFDKEHWN